MSKSNRGRPCIGRRNSSALAIKHTIGRQKNRPWEKQSIFRKKMPQNPDRKKKLKAENRKRKFGGESGKKKGGKCAKPYGGQMNRITPLAHFLLLWHR
jgi:hypothetical protein